MLLEQILSLKEGVTFNAVDLKTGDDGKQYTQARENKVTKECWVCRGEGVEYYTDDAGQRKPYECDYCHGKKTIEEWEAEGPEMQVSNANAFLICQMLGIEEDYVGMVHAKDIPKLLQRLMVLKNSPKQANAHVRPDEVLKGQTRVDRSGDVPQITSGPTIHSFGVDASRIQQYVDKMIEMCQFAQKNGMSIGWG